jgi:hypothetical protein
LSFTRSSLINSPAREEEDHHEVEKFKKKNPTTRETFARRPQKAGQAKRKTEGGRGGKGNESCQEIGCPRYSGSSGSQVSGANDRGEETAPRQESEEKTESLTGTPCAACGRYESQVGREESR